MYFRQMTSPELIKLSVKLLARWSKMSSRQRKQCLRPKKLSNIREKFHTQPWKSQIFMVKVKFPCTFHPEKLSFWYYYITFVLCFCLCELWYHLVVLANLDWWCSSSFNKYLKPVLFICFTNCRVFCFLLFEFFFSAWYF